MKSVQWLSAVIATAALVTACGDPTKEDILKKAEGIHERQLLEQALGKPDDVSKVGPIETWTYDAANGSVAFVLAGDTVTLSKTGDKREN